MLDITTATNQVEAALVRAVTLGLRKRQPAVATLDALRAVPTRGASGGPLYDVAVPPLRFIAGAGRCYLWEGYSVEPDDGDEVIAPTDAGGKPGRWTKTSSPSQDGYLEAVRLSEGDSSIVAILDKLFGKTPSVLIVWTGEEHTPKSINQGALYGWTVSFDLWVASQNLRPGNEALIGSGVPAEAARDPGVNRIVGDLKKLLAGSDLGEEGIDYCQIGKVQKLAEDQSERRYLHMLSVQVRASLHIPDEESFTLDEPGDLRLEYALADAGGTPSFNGRSYVASGLRVPVGAGLAVTIGAGAAFIDGEAVSYAGGTVELPALSRTLRDLSPDGSLTLVSIPFDALEPPLTHGALRVGETWTDEAGVTADFYRCPSLTSYGEPDWQPKP